MRSQKKESGNVAVQLGIILFNIKYLCDLFTGPDEKSVLKLLTKENPTDFFRLGEKEFNIMAADQSHSMIWACLNLLHEKPSLQMIRESPYV